MSYLSLVSTVSEFNGSKSKPSWLDVESSLYKLLDFDGCVGIDVMEAPDIGPISLSVRAENKQYLITMLVNINLDDDEVRFYTNLEIEHEGNQISILGDFWDSTEVCNDIDVVVKIFKEFYETGDVSRSLLNSKK